MVAKYLRKVRNSFTVVIGFAGLVLLILGCIGRDGWEISSGISFLGVALIAPLF